MTALLERPETIEVNRNDVRTLVVAKKDGKETKRPEEKTALRKIFEGHREFLGCTPD